METRVQPVVPPDVPRRLLTVAEYEAMVPAGIRCEEEETIVERDGVLSPLAFPDFQVAAADILQ